MSTSTSTAVLHKLLRQFGSDKYHIEYNDFFSSHVLHALVALHRLGANDSRLGKHADVHASWLEPAKPLEPDRKICDDDWKSSLGKRNNYREFSEFFLEKISLCNAGEVVGRYVPEMASGGLCVAAFHPLIHIGYGLLAEQNEDVADGLAYMAFAYRSPQARRSDWMDGERSVTSPAGAPVLAAGPAGHPVLALVRKMRLDGRLKELVRLLRARIDPATMEKGTGKGRFDHRMFMVDDHARDILLDYVGESGLLPVNSGSPTTGDILSALQSLFEGAVLVFALARPENDFFLLHGVTSAYALSIVLDHLSSAEVKVDVIRLFFAGLLATFIVQDMPILADIIWPSECEVPAWDTIVTAAIADDDEHTIKLVFSCHEAEKSFVADVRGVPLYRTVAAWRLGLMPWPQK